MEYRYLGQSGLKLSCMGLGSWITFAKQVDVKAAQEMIAYAFDQGINFFDNAEVYAQGQSELCMGQALKQLKLPRDAFCVSSKVFWGGDKPTQRGLSKKHIFEACHQALKRLQVDYLDLYFCHRPDLNTPIEEIVQAMHQLILQGKILYWGTSEWPADLIMQAYFTAKMNHLTPPVMEQPEYNLLHRERMEKEYLNIFKTCGYGSTIWSPLASGILTGKYNTGIPKDSRAMTSSQLGLQTLLTSEAGKTKINKVTQLIPIASALQINMAQLAIAWCLKNPHVSVVILGASRLGQLKENCQSLDAIEKLTPEVMTAIEAIMDNAPELPHDFRQ